MKTHDKKKALTLIALASMFALPIVIGKCQAEEITHHAMLTNQFDQPFNVAISTASKNAVDPAKKELKRAISAALVKHAKLPAAKRKGKCPIAHVKLAAGTVSKTALGIAIREVRAEVKPFYHEFKSHRARVQWRYRGHIETLCVFFEGPGHH